MQNTHFKFLLRKPKDELSDSAIYLYCNVNGKVKYFTTGLKIQKASWSQKDQRPRPGCVNFNTISVKLESISNELSSILMHKNASRKQIGMIDISSVFTSGKTSTDLIQWMTIHLDTFSATYTAQSLKTYRAQLTKLKQFCSAVEFESIDVSWWRKYEKFLILRGNIETTRHKAFKHLKSFINKAIEAGIIDKNPWQYVKVKAGESSRQFLTISELQSIQAQFNKLTNQKMINAGKAFLFACFTGLRYSDIRNLEWKNIIEGTISIRMQKSKKNHTIPLNHAAQELLPERSTGKVFRIYANQKINQYVKELVKLAGIDKKISFHCARHTFATISLELSGDIATVSKLLGHSAISTTQIYAKVMDQSKKTVINKWNALNVCTQAKITADQGKEFSGSETVISLN